MKQLTIKRILQYYPDRLFKYALASAGFRSSFIPTPIARHHIYRYKGKGALPPLIILHGGADSAGTYLPLLLRLKKSFQEIIALEAAGHGLSGEPQATYTYDAHYTSMFAALDALIDPHNPAIILGNSLGGLTALHYAIHSSDRVKGLFLTSPMGAPMTDAMLADLRHIFSPTNAREAAVFAHRVQHHIPRVKSPIINHLTYAWITRRAIRDLIEATTTGDGVSTDQLKQVQAPTYMICGQSDRIMTPNAVEFFRQNLSRLEMIRPTKLGHCPHLENPQLVADKLLEFSQKIAQ